MSASLMSIAEYAACVGLNPSTISRAVTKGSIPVVELADGRRMIDREAADKARRENSNIARGHGGRADRAVRREGLWQRKNQTGYAPESRVVLNFMNTAWLALMQRGMTVLGAAEIDQVRALLVLSELTQFLAVALHDDTRSDYRQFLEPENWPSFTDEEAQQFLSKWGEEEIVGSGIWTDEDKGLPGGSEFYEQVSDTTFTAFPS